MKQAIRRNPLWLQSTTSP